MGDWSTSSRQLGRYVQVEKFCCHHMLTTSNDRLAIRRMAHMDIQEVKKGLQDVYVDCNMGSQT